jgi:hypothetical protein
MLAYPIHVRFQFFDSLSGAYRDGHGTSRNNAARDLGILEEGDGQQGKLKAGWHLVEVWDGGDCLWRDDQAPEAWAEAQGKLPHGLPAGARSVAYRGEFKPRSGAPDHTLLVHANAAEGYDFRVFVDLLSPTAESGWSLDIGVRADGSVVWNAQPSERPVPEIPHVFHIFAGEPEHDPKMAPGWYAQFKADMDCGTIYGPFKTKPEALNTKRKA